MLTLSILAIFILGAVAGFGLATLFYSERNERYHQAIERFEAQRARVEAHLGIMREVE